MSRPVEIIAVDDEPDMRALLEDYLSLQGFAVRTAADAAGLDRELASRPADLILLDVNMPGESGFDALARLRRSGAAAGIIMLTAAGEVPARVQGLAGGADDYLAKPFEPRELLARVRAVLRRLAPAPAASAPALVAMGRCRLDLDGHRLLDAEGNPLPLTAMEFDLLQVFARHPRQTLARDRLAELAHGRPLAPGDRSIDIRVARLRQRLEIDPGTPQTLLTVRGEGYRFEP